ncbi:DUF1127 domain-containing protein [Aliamphritea hakodatensis]|uniref:DUF1127 domain-containing protein n=1 Tax=Aliamphritea hakodatensis TaxID=2895352 RepID=UPI0022FD7931|nr:DUF1127 domain-containing protein [Aliamphritea hakodatensis]
MTPLVNPLKGRAGRSRPLLVAISARIGRLLILTRGASAACIFNYRSRLQLKMLDDDALKDIGISRADALSEAHKPCWKNSRG